MKYNTSHAQIDQDKLKTLLPENSWSLLKDEEFIKSVFAVAKENHESLSQMENKRSIITSIYQLVLESIRENKTWRARTFLLTSYHGQQNDAKIGISLRSFCVMEAASGEVVFEMNVRKMKFRVTTFSLRLRQS